MYALLNLVVDNRDKETDVYDRFLCYKEEGCKKKDELANNFIIDLKKYIWEGVIDGTALSGDWFQSVQSDVFISYSHNDQDIAMESLDFYRANLS